MVYLCFLGFYGFVFPTYLWIHGFPGRGVGSVASRRTLLWLGIVVAVVFPFYWMAFIERQYAWLAPGLVIILASRMLVPQESETA